MELQKEARLIKEESAASPGPAVVGIGASAGGLAALREFFSRTPGQTGLVFVVVVHLSPQHESYLADIIQQHCNMAVTQVAGDTPLEPNHVYVIPPGRNLSSIDTHLRLSPLESERRFRAPIDHFFDTLADTHGASAVGVVLSGTGSDGAVGLRKIKCAGGLTIAQDPTEAEYDGMPQSAIATGSVDFILPVAEMPGHILGFSNTAPLVSIAGDDALPSANQKLLAKIFTQVRTRTGHDFSRYKPSTALRRIRRRMQLRQMENLSEYLELLKQNPEECQTLVDDMLITVTNFFRDPEVFDGIATEILPRLFGAKGPDDRVRVWSIGCSTGEEAYSLAILLHEEASKYEQPPAIQVFASDLHKPSLISARDGNYPDAIETDISPQRLHRYFTKVSNGYQIRKEIRDLVIFASHNFLKDPPFSQIDLLVCRNVLIYLNREVQEDVIQLFHYSLNPGGFLVLGSSETAQHSEYFRLTNKNNCVYRRRDMAAREPRLPVFPITASKPTGASKSPALHDEHLTPGVLHQKLVERLAPPSILLSRDHNIVHLSERAGAYLYQPGGEPTNNIFKRIREELRAQLRYIVEFARDKRIPARSVPVNLYMDGALRQVTMQARPADEVDFEGFLLLLFDNAEVPESASDLVPAPARDSGREAEVEHLKQRLQAVIRDFDTSKEEMRASNEELQSSNEELRSTMEELETSKEELQSLNEELQTLNQENRHKVEELSQLSADLQNVLTATDIATLFLDRELRILRFTPRVGELFNIRPVDRGRPLSDLTHRLGYETLLRDAREVLTRFVSIEHEVRSEDGSWYLTRLLPYRSSHDRVDGVVLTFINITRAKQTEQAVRESEERYRLLVESVHEYALFMMNKQGRIVTWSPGAQRLFGYHEQDCIGRPVATLYTKEDCENLVPEAELEMAARDGRAAGKRWYVRQDGSRFLASGVITSLYHADGELRGYAKVMRDNSGRMTAETELQEFARIIHKELWELLQGLVQPLIRRFNPSRDAELAQLADYISSGILRIEKLMEELLNYSHIANSGLEDPQPADAARALQVAIRVLDEEIRTTKASIHCDGHLPIVRANEDQLAVVFQKLLSNAMKYTTEDSTPDIRIAAERKDSEWIFAVSGKGIGFAPEYTGPGVWPPERMQGGTSPGGGISMAICRQILERYGGRIWAGSAGEVQGECFCFALPADQRQ